MDRHSTEWLLKRAEEADQLEKLVAAPYSNCAWLREEWRKTREELTKLERRFTAYKAWHKRRMEELGDV